MLSIARAAFASSAWSRVGSPPSPCLVPLVLALVGCGFSYPRLPVPYPLSHIIHRPAPLAVIIYTPGGTGLGRIASL